MSGIEKMKEKIRKKMTLDDLPTSLSENESESIAVHTEVQTEARSEYAFDEKASVLPESNYHANQSISPNQPLPSNRPSLRENTQQNRFPETQPYSITNTQQPPKTQYGRKMTLYLTESLYKAFNDIYARRMLEGRKTEKSALICEAVEFLVRNENKEFLES